ncbi:NUDIX hydrolase [Paenibacillus sp. FSL R5-0713]|uniref:NUDIX hydrolase n=1 Tax=Paenibacillus sp. FSL R5-0713 TaxID=2921655 RepID=UPI0030DB3AFF
MNNEYKYLQYDWKYSKDDLKFCPRCGSHFVLQDLHISDQPQLVCDNCRFIFYLDPKLVVVGLVLFENKVLLLKRAENPGKGLWGLPGGHVERGEDLFETVEREIREESGAQVQLKEIIKTHSLAQYGTVQLAFEAIAKDAYLKTNIESFEAKYFAWNEIPWDSLAFETTREILFEFADINRINILKENN